MAITPLPPHAESRPALDPSGDDKAIPFATQDVGVVGRLVRLGPAVNKILTRHDYADDVCIALGEALTLVSLLGTALKFDGRLILQTKSDGPLRLVVADYGAPGHLRGYAQFSASEMGKSAEPGESQQNRQRALLGNGHLAMTIDQGAEMERYQGIVALDRSTLVEAAHTYFRQSEQLPTFIRIAVARHFASGQWTWRAGGLMVQKVPRTGSAQSKTVGDEEHDARLDGEDDEDFSRVRLLAATVEDHELTDPNLDSLRLLYRLFHDEGVTARQAQPVLAKCRCSRDRLLGHLKSFDAAALADMRDPDGRLRATCEFCSTVYAFDMADI
jgi:molecular chaperone Hsp33